MEYQQDVLTEIVSASTIKRSKLLPWWIKVFMWIFLVFGLLVPICIVAAVLDMRFEMAIYGLETNEPLSITGLLLIAIFLLKGVVSFGLLKEKGWAIKLGIIDSIVGIIICVLLSYVFPFIYSEVFKFSLIKVELIFLIPYLIKLRKIKDEWERSGIIV